MRTPPSSKRQAQEVPKGSGLKPTGNEGDGSPSGVFCAVSVYEVVELGPLLDGRAVCRECWELSVSGQKNFWFLNNPWGKGGGLV
jgi:hypothetical protein